MNFQETARHSARRAKSSEGFTLVELTMVLVIIALLTSGLIISFSAQKDITDTTDTERQLTVANEALLGFAAVHGRLPCPAVDSASGVEAPVGGGECTTSFGFLPAVTLGITPTNADGYSVDSWNNRVRYAVTTANAAAFTSANGIKGLWSNPALLLPDLHVCPSAALITNVGAANSACNGSSALTDKAVAVLVSNGKNGGIDPPPGPDEIPNVPDADPIDRSFVSRSPSPNYDDVVTWLSANLLYNRMLAAGRLP